MCAAWVHRVLCLCVLCGGWEVVISCCSIIKCVPCVHYLVPLMKAFGGTHHIHQIQQHDFAPMLHANYYCYQHKGSAISRGGTSKILVAFVQTLKFQVPWAIADPWLMLSWKAAMGNSMSDISLLVSRCYCTTNKC